MTAQIKPAIDEIAATLPPGMRIEVGGAVEESAKANAALFKIFPLMFLAMLTILDGTAAQVLDAVPGVIDRAAGPHRCEFLGCLRSMLRSASTRSSVSSRSPA